MAFCAAVAFSSFASPGRIVLLALVRAVMSAACGGWAAKCGGGGGGAAAARAAALFSLACMTWVARSS